MSVLYRVHDCSKPIGGPDEVVHEGRSRRKAMEIFEKLPNALITGGHPDEHHYRLLEYTPWARQQAALAAAGAR